MSDEKNDGKKTEEQLAQERLERYKKEPNRFVEVSEMIACVVRTSDAGPMILIKGTKFELQLAWAELNQKIMQKISQQEMEATMKKQALIKPGFLGGIRNMGRKR